MTDHEEYLQRQIELLKASNKIIADERDRLKAAPVAPDGVPDGFELVAVKGFDDLVYWLNRCAEKGHLEACSDLIDPWSAFGYRKVATTNAATVALQTAENRAELLAAAPKVTP